MTWDPFSQPVNNIKINSQTIPGVTTFEPCDGEPRKWDDMQGPGFSGSFLRYMGNGLAEFTILVKLTNPEEWKQWYAFAKLLLPVPTGKRPSALTIWHPLLIVPPNKIEKVVVVNVSVPERITGNCWLVKIKMKQFRVPKMASAKPVAAETAAVLTPNQIVMAAQAEQIKLASYLAFNEPAKK